MATSLPRVLLRIRYADAAEVYLHKLPLEHFMEATPQATQREITVESLALVRAQRPDVQYFNELLVQYPLPGTEDLGQVVPDNMLVVCEEPIDAEGSYDVPFQPARPFCVMEYVSKRNRRKDYEDSFRKYEKELKVPYYLIFYPEAQEMTLFRLRQGKYVSVKPNKHGRCAIPKLELEVGILDGWVRFWFRGELLPLPAELQRQVDDLRRQLAKEKRRADQEQQARQAAEQEVARLRAELERYRKGNGKRS